MGLGGRRRLHCVGDTKDGGSRKVPKKKKEAASFPKEKKIYIGDDKKGGGARSFPNTAL